MKKLNFLPPGSISLRGTLGTALHNTVYNRLLQINYSRLVDPFRFRNEEDRLWRCEFWGKIVRSAIRCLRCEPSPELLVTIKNTVEDLLSTRSSDGCISSYPTDQQLLGWDIWGRKYVMKALIRYYDDIDSSPQIKAALADMLDQLIRQLKGKPICHFGEHQGLAAASILGAIVDIYRITGKTRFLEFAKTIIDSGCCSRHNIFAAAREKIPLRKIGNGKAYEMMSCFEGLAAYCQYDPQPEYLEAVKNFFAAICKNEIFITGSGGLMDMHGEYWGDGKFNQTRSSVGGLGETCVTVTYIHLCSALLKLTGDPVAAAELMNTTCNALLGAVSPDGKFWCHVNPTPLAGSSPKIPASDQISRAGADSFDGHDCCLAQGPEGLATVAMNAVMSSSDGVVLNYYEPMHVQCALPSGKFLQLECNSEYPYPGQIELRLHLAEPESFELALLIPPWQQSACSVSVNLEKVSAKPGEYLVLKRRWCDGDVVRFELDFSLRSCVSPDGRFVAFSTGPLLLSRDSRLGEVNTPVVAGNDCSELPPCQENNIRLIRQLKDGSSLCDYISAGNAFHPGDVLRVWLEPENSSQ